MEVRDQAGDSPEFRNLVLGHDALSSLLRNATWTLSNFCRGKPSPDWKYIQLQNSCWHLVI